MTQQEAKSKRNHEIQLKGEVSKIRVLHQVTKISFLHNSNNSWTYQGTTNLYVSCPSHELAFHARGGVTITSISVQTATPSSLQHLHVDYQHLDPLELVLTNSCTRKRQFEADAQQHRGGAGFMTALRASTLASSLGEIRIKASNMLSNNQKYAPNDVLECWKQELFSNVKNNNNPRRQDRLSFVAQQLSQTKSFKVSIKFFIPSKLCNDDGGGLLFRNNVVFTNSHGLAGDPYASIRTWLPCCDSFCAHHRSSHELTLTLTSNNSNLTIVGCGETNFGSLEKLSKVMTRWTTEIYTPIAIHCLGFAIGPFQTIVDPELTNIQHCFFSRDLETITASTSGVPLRALSIMREVLGCMHFPSNTYTQIFIPNSNSGHTCGSLDFNLNSFLGGAIIDANLLPPPKTRLPFYAGGRVLQLQQAKSALWGWILSSLSMLGCSSKQDVYDEVGDSYLHLIFLEFITNIYERACGATGEGGSKYSFFYNGNVTGAGLNASVLDLLPVKNVDDEEQVHISKEEKNNSELWRGGSTKNNGTESRTSSLDEYQVRKLLVLDTIEALERSDKVPSSNWLGSHYSVSFLSSNSCSSSYVGCGGIEQLHPTSMFYRYMKCNGLARIMENRATLANLTRVLRCCFIATFLYDQGKTHCDWGSSPSVDDDKTIEQDDDVSELKEQLRKPAFIVCIDEILKTGGMTHSLFTRCLRLLSKDREPFLRGTLVDVSRDVKINVETYYKDGKRHTQQHLTEPEGFPNSYIRGRSMLYMRAGCLVEPAGGSETTGNTGTLAAAAAVKGIHLHVYVEPVIPEGGAAFGGFMTLRVVENEGQVREFSKNLSVEGCRCEWGPIFLHAKAVTTAKQQTAASGTIEGNTSAVNAVSGGISSSVGSGTVNDGSGGGGGSAVSQVLKKTRKYKLDQMFSLADSLQNVGYQALELVRLTNRTPLLWIRIDPYYHYCSRMAIFQPDACLGEQLFHDGDAGAQVDAIRALAERPLRIQGSVKINTVYDVPVHELPARLLGDCVRGSPALHCSLPHTPVVRAQAALALGQWQNNKAPISHNAVGVDSWLGLHLLLLYFKERFYGDGYFLPVKFTRIVIKKGNEEETGNTASSSHGGKKENTDGDGVGDSSNTGAETGDNEDVVTETKPKRTVTSATATAGSNSEYLYLDSFDVEDRLSIIEEAEDIQIEEDEEYRVRSAVVTAIASIRAKNGLTPPIVLEFLENLLLEGDFGGSMSTTVEDESYLLPGSSKRIKKSSILDRRNKSKRKEDEDEDVDVDEDMQQSLHLNLPYISSSLLADALLALCHVNCRPSDDAATAGTQTNQPHPIIPLMEVCHRLLEWELYKEVTRLEKMSDGEINANDIGGDCYTCVAASAITALCSMAILKQSTSNVETFTTMNDGKIVDSMEIDSFDHKRDIGQKNKKLEEAASAEFYVGIFDSIPQRADTIRAAAAQAVVMICCAADRLGDSSDPLGLLTAFDFLLNRILEKTTSTSLRLTLAALMLDTCTGKVCSFQRVATIGGKSDFSVSAARFFNGPLGASYGGDNGSALLMSVSEITYPSANAVNNGARGGLKLLAKAGSRDHYSKKTIIKVARFATKLWRTMNGEDVVSSGLSPSERKRAGICAKDGRLRIALLALWQRIWPKICFAVARTQYLDEKGNKFYDDIDVMKCTEEEKKMSDAEEQSLAGLKNIVSAEIDRQEWRGEMAGKGYEYWKCKGKKDHSGTNTQGLENPLPVIEKDSAWKLGGWAASAQQQRRAKALDGGSKVHKVRLTVKSSIDD